jgi:hypothetical protein
VYIFFFSICIFVFVVIRNFKKLGNLAIFYNIPKRLCSPLLNSFLFNSVLLCTWMEHLSINLSTMPLMSNPPDLVRAPVPFWNRVWSIYQEMLTAMLPQEFCVFGKVRTFILTFLLLLPYGTLSLDFWPPVFFIKQFHLVPLTQS